MIKEVTMYTVVCDRCGKDACADSESSCWSEPAFVREMACDGWEEVGSKDYCPDCVMWNEDESELIPKPTT